MLFVLEKLHLTWAEILANPFFRVNGYTLDVIWWLNLLFFGHELPAP